MIIDREVSTDTMLIRIVTFDQVNQYRIRRNSQRLFEHIQVSGLAMVLYNSKHSGIDCDKKFKQKASALVARWVSIGDPECCQQCCCLNFNTLNDSNRSVTSYFHVSTIEYSGSNNRLRLRNLIHGNMLSLSLKNNRKKTFH